MILPTEVSVLLRAWNVLGIPAFVVGGAVRDTVMDKQIADYDIAIESDVRGVDVTALALIAKLLHMTFEALGGDYEAAEMRVFELRNENVVIQCMLSTNNVEEELARFSCNASKLYYDHINDVIVTTPEFDKFKETGELVFADDVLPRYQDKITQKFS